MRANILRFLLLPIPSVILGSITNLYCFYTHIFWSVSLIRYCHLDIGILIYWCQACASQYFIPSSSNTPKNSHNRASSSFSAYSAKGCYLLLPLSTLCLMLPSGYHCIDSCLQMRDTGIGQFNIYFFWQHDPSRIQLRQETLIINPQER